MTVLTAYYSRRGQNYWAGEIRDLPRGNTETAAEYIREAVGGDVFRIETARPYDTDYKRCCAEAAAELKGGVRPELGPCPESLDGYDTVFLGFPNWCGTMPMAVFAFLERYDLSGKRVFPFCTNEGSGFGKSLGDLEEECPGARIGEGLSVIGHEVQDSRERIQEWARKSLGE